MKTVLKITILSLFFFTLGCSKDDNEVQVPAVVKSDAKELLAISFDIAVNPDLPSKISGSVEQGGKTASVNFPIGTSVSALIPTIQISNMATYSPKGVQDFSNGVTYTITAENGTTNNYVVNVAVSQSSERLMVSFVFLKTDNGIDNNIVGSVDNENKEVLVITKADTDVLVLLPQLEVSEGASYAPQGVQDFSEPVNYTITAADGTASNFTVTIKTERDLLIAIAEANPNNTLNWSFGESDLDDWHAVRLNEHGYVTELDFDNENLSVLPDEIGYFRKLQRLDLEDNNLTELPKNMGLLTNLIELFLSGNKLKELPSEFAQLESLNVLWLTENMLEEFPEEVFQLTNLIELDLSQNLLKSLPSGFSQMTALNELVLDENQFEEFPEEIFQLTNLTDLRYRRNQLKELPNGIANLEKLQNLNLHDNLLSSLPDEVQFLNRLSTIYLSRNQFEEIPEVLLVLTSFVLINLNDNMVKKINIEITALNRLTYLYLNNNLLTALPGELDLMYNLLHLEIRGNPIEFLPEELCPATYLTIAKDDTTICK